ncbi:hypothetical protein P5X00_40050 (plasmid) [Paraburkholderia sp. A2RO-4L]|uniref:hypothetical protein n=1 Tax=Paraburkholderia sp. A2RO-4L TaxID=3028374 RepID=UPI003DA86D08
MKNTTEHTNQAAAFVDACSNFVAQLDKHQTGGAMFICCIALLLVGVVVVALSVPLRAAQPSRDDAPEVRKSAQRAPAADDSRKVRADNNQQPRG